MSGKTKKMRSYQKRLALAEQVGKSLNFQSLLQYVNDATYKFIMCQVRNQKVKPRARRYTLDEKILALSLFKYSGKGYRFLQAKYFR